MPQLDITVFFNQFFWFFFNFFILYAFMTCFVIPKLNFYFRIRRNFKFLTSHLNKRMKVEYLPQFKFKLDSRNRKSFSALVNQYFRSSYMVIYKHRALKIMNNKREFLIFLTSPRFSEIFWFLTINQVVNFLVVFEIFRVKGQVCCRFFNKLSISIVKFV